MHLNTSLTAAVLRAPGLALALCSETSSQQTLNAPQTDVRGKMNTSSMNPINMKYLWPYLANVLAQWCQKHAKQRMQR